MEKIDYLNFIDHTIELELRTIASALEVPFYMQYTRPGYSDFMYDMVEINGKMMD